MKAERLNEIVESYINGNISYTKREITKMTKKELIDFIEVLTEFSGNTLKQSLMKAKGLLY